jgi:hypothetical protein
MGRWGRGDGEGRWGDGEMGRGREGEGETRRILTFNL